MKVDIHARSHAAKMVLNSAAFATLVDEVKREIFGQWSRTNSADTEQREQLHSIVYGLDNLISKAEKYAGEVQFEQDRDNNAPIA